MYRKILFVSAPSLSTSITSLSGKNVCAQRRDVLYFVGIHGRVARKKPVISNTNRQKRLEIAKTHLNKTIEFWKNVIFSDESKFNIFGSDGIKYV